MKFNWKVAIASVLILVSIVFAITSTSASSYTGKNLTFAVGTGSVSIINSSDVAIPVQLLGTGSRSFTIKSTIDDVSGSSTRDGSGSSATQIFDFDLPAGVNEFTITRGSNVNFVAETDTKLEATVQAMTANQSNTTMIAVIVFILIALYFISNTTNHQWIALLRNSNKATETSPAQKSELGQGVNLKSYGDNRK
jgi:hypothetical protein